VSRTKASRDDQLVMSQCSRPEHASSRVAFGGHYDRPGHRRRYRWQLPDGSKWHRLTTPSSRHDVEEGRPIPCGVVAFNVSGALGFGERRGPLRRLQPSHPAGADNWESSICLLTGPPQRVVFDAHGSIRTAVDGANGSNPPAARTGRERPAGDAQLPT
jgi:hypothetical protein